MDVTAWWVMFRHYKQVLGHLLAAIVIFALGWQLNTIFSSRAAAVPIVFNDRECVAQASAGGDAAALTQLREAGIASATTPPVAQQAAISEQPVVAGVSTTTSAPSAAPTTKLFVASVNSTLYHHRDCSARNQIKAENEVWFDSAQQAQAAGYKPSKCTQELVGEN